MRDSRNDNRRSTRDMTSKSTNRSANKTSNRSTSRNANISKERAKSYKSDRSYEKIGSSANKKRDNYKKNTKNLKKLTSNNTKRNVQQLPSENINRRNKKNMYNVNVTPTVATVGNSDVILTAVIYVLVAFGILMIYSASNYQARLNSGDPFAFAKKQTMAAVLGLTIMHIIASNKVITYTDLKKFNLPTLVYLFCIFLLVILPFVGLSEGGQTRWLPIPIFGQFQPSEVMKHGLIIFLADYISRNRERMKSFKFYFVLIGLVLLPVALTVGNNLSTSIILLIIGIGMIFVASPYFWRLIFIGIGGIIASAGALVTYLTFSDSFRNARFEAWKDPFANRIAVGWQTVQSLLAIGSGGLFGLGIGKGRQKLFYIPEAHNDIIFAIICEELGFIGASFLILIFIVLFWRGIKIAVNAKELFGSLIATGVTIMIAVQTMINISVTTNTIPNTGIGLPFISYGGTSILFLLAMMGVVLNISKFKLQEK